MKSVVLLLIITVFTVSCKNSTQPKGKVQFTILNDSLFYYAKGDSLQREWYLNCPDSICDAKSVNVIRYRVTNTTDKNYLLFLKEIDLIQLQGINFSITYPNNDTIRGANHLVHPVFTDDCQLCEMNLLVKNEDVKNDKYNHLGVLNDKERYDNYFRQAVIVRAGESWDFTALLSLPFAKENYTFRLPEAADLKFAVELNYDKNLINKVLLKTEKDNLKRNNIEVFNGKIISNKVVLTAKY